MSRNTTEGFTFFSERSALNDFLAMVVSVYGSGMGTFTGMWDSKASVSDDD